MGAPAGWYADPWGQSVLRWWTGTQWTGWTDPTPCPELAGTRPRGVITRGVVHGDPHCVSSLAGVLAEGTRVAVIDVETTGLYRTDRIVEVAVVTMDCAGTVIDEFETLVNPHRDPGPTWIHGVTASMLVDAPSFDDIAEHLATRLHGAVVAGHNLQFDTRMISREFIRSGIDIDWGTGLDTLHATGCKLGVACLEYDVPHDSAHRALSDARATGQLLVAVADAFTGSYIPTTAAHTPVSRPLRRVLTRDGFNDVDLDVPYLADLARGVHADTEVAAYVTLLDQAVADLRLTEQERTELTCLAAELGLDDRSRERAHREFLNGLIDAALEDSVVTDEELDQLCRAAALLNLDTSLVTRRTNPFRLRTDTVTLEPGLTVCFTGAALDEDGIPIDRKATIEPQSRDHGLVPSDSCTKTTGLLIAADTASESTKLDAARRYGIPVAALADYQKALMQGGTLTVTRLAGAGIALVCSQCGDSWMAARRANTPICAGCRRRPRTAVPAAAAPSPPVIETLACTVCMDSWERPRLRGRRPTRCRSCA